MAARTGERKLRILQVLAELLEDPKGEKVTTAGLAARLECSEAALYRHFASKAQMFEGLIEFIESSLFGLINQVRDEETDGLRQVEAICALMLRFAEANRGMTRVLIGDALVNENERLQARINQLGDKLEAALKQSLRVAATQGSVSSAATPVAGILLAFVVGRWHAYAKSGFTRDPAANWAREWPLLVGLCRGATVAA